MLARLLPLEAYMLHSFARLSLLRFEQARLLVQAGEADVRFWLIGHVMLSSVRVE